MTKPRAGLKWMFVVMFMPWLMIPPILWLQSVAGLERPDSWYLYATSYTLMSPIFLMFAWIFGAWFAEEDFKDEQRKKYERLP
jgi:hypothetical protein